MERGRTLAVMAAGAAMALGGGLVAGGPSTVEHAAATPAPETFEPLSEAFEKAEAAKRLKPKKGRKYVALIRGAIDAKHEFVDVAFGQQTLFGCNVNQLFRAMEDADLASSTVFAALRGGRGKEEAAAQTVEAARALKGLVGRCPQATRKVKNLARQVLENAQAAKESVETGSKPYEFLHRLHDRKMDMLRGTKVYGCGALAFFEAIDRADVNLYFAAFVDGQSEHSKEHSLTLVLEELEKLDKLWAQVPCGGTTVPPPENPACSDGVGGDFPDNQACLSPQDTTDQSHSWTFFYPGNGGTATNFIDFKAGFKEGVPIMAVAYRVFSSSTVHESASVNHGAVPISGTMPCSGLSGTTIRAGIGGQAPTGAGLPAAPGDDHMRIVIDTTDPAGGVDCGTGTVTLQVAADTR